MKNLVCMLAVFSAVSMLSVRAGDDVDDLLDDLSDKGAEAADGGSDEGSDESSDEGADPASDADDTADGGDAPRQMFQAPGNWITPSWIR